MSDLISREAAIAALREASARPSSISELEALPAITPQVYINVTGGVADVICADHQVGVTVLDYDIRDDEQDDYCIDEDGDQVWIYGETAKVDPERCQKIVDYPTVAEAREDA